MNEAKFFFDMKIDKKKYFRSFGINLVRKNFCLINKA